MSRGMSWTERRRARLARRAEALERLESRSLVTESLGMLLGQGGLLAAAEYAEAGRGGPRPGRPRGVAGQAAPALVTATHAAAPIAVAATPPRPRSAAPPVDDGRDASPAAPGTTADWLDLRSLAGREAAEDDFVAAAPDGRPAGSSGALDRGAITLLQFPETRPRAAAAGPSGASDTSANFAGLGLAATNGGPIIGGDAGDASPDPGGLPGGGVSTANFGAGNLGSGGGFDAELNSIAGPGGESLMSFSSFPLYTLDMRYGVVLFDGMAQIGLAGSSIDLRAQVRDATVASYSWDTTNLTNATSIGVTNTYKLTFNWGNNIPNPGTNSVTLTVTDTASNVETQTYYFWFPGGQSVGGSGGGGIPSWPNSLAPDPALPDPTEFASHHVDVEALTGALETRINLPAYSPNFAGATFEYDSLAADTRPIVLAHHPLDPSLAAPTRTTAQLTFNGTAGSTYHYATNAFIPGAYAQFALQADATALSTGRYAYTATIADVRGTTTTATYTGNAIVASPADEPFNSFGKGWTLRGMARIHAATGGVILRQGSNDALWFTSSSPTTFTSPAGDFSTLVKNSGSNTYTRTMKDGTKQEYDSSGFLTTTVDRNGLRVTYTYSSSQLTKITDPYAKATTFTYSGGRLRSVEDPASRLTTFSFTGSDLDGVLLPDGATWAYDYDGSGRMTKVTDPLSRNVTIAYDAANRVGTVTRPDGAAEAFAGYQVRGYDTTGTSGSPAPATLWAEARGTKVDARGNSVDYRADWRGLGTDAQRTDEAGKVWSADRDAAGLATVTIDRLNRVMRYGYDNKGNVTSERFPDTSATVKAGNVRTYAYNSFAQPTSVTNELGKVTTYTYDGEGNLTEVRDPLNNRTTMTYTANGLVETAKDARLNVTTYQYDSQDRLTTTTLADPDGAGTLTASPVKYAYDARGNVATVTDERSNSTTSAYDALNRTTGVTDALGNRVTYTFDSGGNNTKVEEPLGRTTTLAYDSLDRVTTVIAPLGRTTTLGYDSGGNLTRSSDPLGRVTTVAYDAVGRPTETVDPLGNRTTTTYDAEGQVTRRADRLNRVTTTTYTSRGWTEAVTDPLGKVATYAYTATGRPGLVIMPDSGGNGVDYTYDDAERVTAVADSLGQRTTFGYDAAGNQITVKDPNGNTTTYAYDGRNRMTTITAPDPDGAGALTSSETAYTYDDAGNRTAVRDGNGNRTTTAYDVLNRATTITDARLATVTLAFDAAARQTGLTDPLSNRTTWSYDAADRTTTMADALGTATYVYDSGGQLVDETDRAGRRTTYAYDSGGRQVNEYWLGAGGTVQRRVTMVYDAEAQLTGSADPDATLTFTYDSGGRQLTARTAGSGSGQPDVTLTATFDEVGRRTSVADNLASVARTTYAYDAASRVASIARSVGGSAGPRVDYAYDSGGRVTSQGRTIGGSGTATTTSFGYDNASRLTTLTHQVAGGASLTTYAYKYDSADRLTTKTIGGSTVTYGYDVADQLTSARGARTEDYAYDSGGNRSSAGYAVTTGNRMTDAPGYTYAYDAEGNLGSQTKTNGAGTGDDVVTTYAYDWRNRLVGVTRRSAGGVGAAVAYQVTYTYDIMGRRIAEQEDSDGAGAGAATRTWHVFDGVETYADFNNAGTMAVRYLHGPAVDELLARTDSGGTTAWYLTDRMGTVRDVASAAGVIVYNASYDSFGNVLTTSGGGGDRFGYTGRELDSGTGLREHRSRFFDTNQGRWTQQDPLWIMADQMNKYRYTSNNVNSYNDPFGLQEDIPGRPQPLPERPLSLEQIWAQAHAARDQVYELRKKAKEAQERAQSAHSADEQRRKDYEFGEKRRLDALAGKMKAQQEKLTNRARKIEYKLYEMQLDDYNKKKLFAYKITVESYQYYSRRLQKDIWSEREKIERIEIPGPPSPIPPSPPRPRMR